MAAPEPTERGERLASKDRAAHPHAKDQRCSIMKPHPPHPWGAIHHEGGLTHWCKGRD